MEVCFHATNRYEGTTDSSLHQRSAWMQLSWPIIYTANLIHSHYLLPLLILHYKAFHLNLTMKWYSLIGESL